MSAVVFASVLVAVTSGGAPPADEDEAQPIPAEIESVLRTPSLANLPRFIKLLKHNNNQVRSRAAVLLGSIGASSPDVFGDQHDKVVAALGKALRDRQAEVAQGAAFALEKIGPGAKAAVPQLIVALKSSKELVPLMASRALGAIGPGAGEAVPALMENLKSPRDETRKGAAMALGKMGPAAHKAIPLLIPQIDRPGGDFAAYALAELGQTEPLLKLAKSDDFTLRMRALKALGDVQPTSDEILSVVRGALRDEDDLVRETAAKVLKKIESSGERKEE